MSYLGISNFGECWSCGETIRVLPHHCSACQTCHGSGSRGTGTSYGGMDELVDCDDCEGTGKAADREDGCGK